MDPEIMVAQGIEKISLRNYAGAVELLEQALKDDPDNAEACYYAGLACSRLGRLQRAEVLLQKALAMDPESANVYFELGLLYAGTSDCKRAGDAFERFQGMAPRDDRNQEIMHLMEGCEGVEKGFLERIRYRLHAAVGGNYDTNVTLEPDAPQGPKDRKPDFSGILFLSAGVIPLETKLLGLGLDYDFYQNLHVKESDFNVTSNKISPSLTFRLWESVVPKAGYRFESTLLSGDEYGRVHEAYGEVTFHLRKGLTTDLRYVYRDQTYCDTSLFQTNSLRSGSLHEAGVRQNFLWKGIAFQLYGQGDFDRTEADFWSYDGFRLSAEAAFRLFFLQIGLEGAYTERRYRADYPGEGRKRLDRGQQYTVAITYMVTSWLSASALNTTWINSSNIDHLFGYNRNITGIFLAAGLP